MIFTRNVLITDSFNRNVRKVDKLGHRADLQKGSLLAACSASCSALMGVQDTIYAQRCQWHAINPASKTEVAACVTQDATKRGWALLTTRDSSKGV